MLIVRMFFLQINFLRIKIKIRMFFLGLLVLLNFWSANSQNSYEIYKEVSKVKKLNAQDLEYKVDSLLQLSKKNNDLFSYREIAHQHAIYFYKKKNFSKAIDYTLLETENFEKNKIISEKYTKALYNLGRFSYYNLEYKEAISYYEKVIEINNNVVRSGQSYAEMGRCFDEMGDYSKASLYYEKGIRILEEHKFYKSLIIHYMNYALLLKQINTKNSIDRALEILEIAEKLVSIIKIRTSNKLSLIGAIASLNVVEKKLQF